MRQVRLDVLRGRHQTVRRPDGAPNREVPSLPLDRAEVSWEALVLQVMNHRQLTRRRRQGHGKPRREDDIQPPPEPLQRQNRLLPHQSQGTNARRDDAAHRVKVFRRRRQVAAGLAIRENVVDIPSVNRRQRRKQIAKVDLRAPNAARNQVEGVDADTKGPWHGMRTAFRPPARSLPARAARAQAKPPPMKLLVRNSAAETPMIPTREYRLGRADR